MSMPASYDISIFYGDTLNLTFTLTDSNNSPIDLTGKTIQFIIRKSVTVYETFTQGNGITISGASNNVINLSKVISVSRGNYYYDLKVITSPEEIRTYLSGTFSIKNTAV